MSVKKSVTLAVSSFICGLNTWLHRPERLYVNNTIFRYGEIYSLIKSEHVVSCWLLSCHSRENPRWFTHTSPRIFDLYLNRDTHTFAFSCLWCPWFDWLHALTQTPCSAVYHKFYLSVRPVCLSWTGINRIFGHVLMCSFSVQIDFWSYRIPQVALVLVLWWIPQKTYCKEHMR